MSNFFGFGNFMKFQSLERRRSVQILQIFKTWKLNIETELSIFKLRLNVVCIKFGKFGLDTDESEPPEVS